MAKMLDRQQQAKENKELRKKFDDLKLSVNKKLDKLGQSANDILMDDLHHLVDYIGWIKIHLDKLINYRNIYILEFLDVRISKILLKVSDDNFVKLEIMEINSLLNNYQNISQEFMEVLDGYLDEAYRSAWTQVGRFAELNDIYKNHKTYEIYQKAEHKYRIAYFLYLFLALIGVCYGLNWSMNLIKSKSKWMAEYGIDVYDFWSIKITAIFIVVTGVTFCLKQAIHYQKKKDKAEQTRLELEALPTYLFNFSDEQKNEVYKKLTGKYFG
ncbi:MAG: hypothetical protein Q4B79_01010 [Moraxella sp.]|uniref:hypothetical protein n=1 Tax=Moraxella sp. TaxID=479 RepID=UPI0026DBE70A|nr:hypothetical protein [Moraxella sp.]MDO4449524.1 hypothetical protein [Moraxella sp.]